MAEKDVLMQQKKDEQEAKRQGKAEQQEAARQAKATKAQQPKSRQRAQAKVNGAAPELMRPADVGVQGVEEAAASAQSEIPRPVTIQQSQATAQVKQAPQRQEVLATTPMQQMLYKNQHSEQGQAGTGGRPRTSKASVECEKEKRR